MSLFPLISTSPPPAAPTDLPLCRDAAWNFVRNCPIFRRGEPVIVTGAEAVQVWAYHALVALRYRYEMYSRDFGSEHENLIGRPYTEALKVSEAARYIREALMINPYIIDVREITTAFADTQLTISGTLVTVYGEVTIRV